MRLFRFVMILAMIGGLTWLGLRTVNVRTTPEGMSITINKQRLKQAGQDAIQRGRKAIGKAGELLERTSQELEEQTGERN